MSPLRFIEETAHWCRESTQDCKSWLKSRRRGFQRACWESLFSQRNEAIDEGRELVNLSPGKTKQNPNILSFALTFLRHAGGLNTAAIFIYLYPH